MQKNYETLDINTLTRLAEANDAEAQAQLANCYAEGLGIGRDDEEAFKWAYKGAKQGNVNAMKILSLAALYGCSDWPNEDEDPTTICEMARGFAWGLLHAYLTNNPEDVGVLKIALNTIPSEQKEETFKYLDRLVLKYGNRNDFKEWLKDNC